MKIKIAPIYSALHLEIERPQTLSDSRIENLIQLVLSGNLSSDISDLVYSDFKIEMTTWLETSNLNTVLGLNKFTRVDIVNGCTQFIDNIYMQGPVQILTGDYRYHQRLNPNLRYSIPGHLSPNKPLIIAMPFPSIGDTHPHMHAILDEALKKNIPVHVDGAWLACCRGIKFDVSHPAIESVAVSLSKGLGLGWNRVGLRWCRESQQDSIAIQNDFHMNIRAPIMIGLHFLRNLPTDYLWTTYEEHNSKICKDFDLIPTKAVHIAMRDNQPVGIAPLIRYLEKR